jgi:hypothetical protein
LSKSPCKIEYGQIVGGILAPDNTGVTIATKDTLSTYTDKMYLTESERYRLLNPQTPYNVEVTPAEMTAVQGNTSNVDYDRGNVTIKFSYKNLTGCDLTALKSLHNNKYYMYTMTKDYLLGNKTATNFIPVPVKISVSDFTPQADNASYWMVDVFVYYLNEEDNFLEIADAKANDWEPTEDIDGVIDVTISNVSGDISDTEVICTVTRSCGSAEIADITTAADFLINDGTTTLVPSGISNVGNVYTLTVAGLTAVPTTIQLKTADVASQKKYETTAAVTFTPSA